MKFQGRLAAGGRGASASRGAAACAVEVRLGQLREAEPRHVRAGQQHGRAARRAHAADRPAVGARRRPDLRIPPRQIVVDRPVKRKVSSSATCR